VAFGILALLVLAMPNRSDADHVTVSPSASARLGEPVGDRSWEVVVNWIINCNGATDPSYGGNLNLIDQVTGEEIYLGGTFGASGEDTAIVARGREPRYLYPQIKAFCGSGPPELHGSGTVVATGNVVEVPPLGGAGGGGGSGAQGGRDFPGGGFGAPSDPLGPGGCARTRRGTGRDDTLDGTSAGDLIFGLAGKDSIRGLGGNDCLIGEGGGDRLLGGEGADRLTGGGAADTLVGGSGVNRYDAGSGNDVVRAANGRRELVSCGPGRDRARVDRRDRARSCEQLTRSG
jgi:Ca2+-binding RTX toxin-like protein